MNRRRYELFVAADEVPDMVKAYTGRVGRSSLTWDCKLRQGAEPGAVMRKELSLSGVQRPLYRGELGPDAVEVFRFGDFAGWLIEG